MLDDQYFIRELELFESLVHPKMEQKEGSQMVLSINVMSCNPQIYNIALLKYNSSEGALNLTMETRIEQSGFQALTEQRQGKTRKLMS